MLAAIAGAPRDLTRYPDGNGFALKAALSAAPRRDVRNRSCSATAATTCSSSRRRRSCAPATTPSTRSTRSSCIRSPRRRAARSASKLPPRIFGHDLDAMRAGDHAAHAHRVRRQSEQSDGNLAHGWRCRSVHRERAARCHRRARRGVQRVSRAGRAARIASRGSTQFPNLIVSRTFSKAYGLAALRVGYGVDGSGGRRPAEPRAAAVQRQRARAGGRGRRARRYRVRRRKAAR